MPKAYIVGVITITDPASYAQYRAKVPGVIAQYGGRYLVRGGAMTQREGADMPERMVILEFDSVAAAQAFYDSPEYAPLLALRHQAATSQLAIVEGID